MHPLLPIVASLSIQNVIKRQARLPEPGRESQP